MPDLSLLEWFLILAALVIGILAGHFGWGKRWPRAFGKLHPDYLTGLDYLVSEQPDRALDMFLKLMDANADTIETHFALGALYRRRGEVERAIRIHQNLLARAALAPEHREQALLALAQDYLRAGLLDRAEQLLQQVSEVPRLRASALAALRGVYERQHEWQQALDTYRQLARIKAAPPKRVAAHYLCELATLAMERGEIDAARNLLRQAREETAPFPRAAVLRAQIAEHEGDLELAERLLRAALRESPDLLQEELPHLLRLVGAERRDALLAELAEAALLRDTGELRQLVFAAVTADVAQAAPLRAAIETVFAKDETLRAVWQAGDGRFERTAREIGALLAHAERYRCGECGFSGRSFYWHCPACQSWETFETYAVVKLR
ncbi:MAG: tetratricopeptide repeat protein [Steroidobacteraceae bacterium]|jgi:lipopolysaccharide biosynthesis regulator YciM